MSAVTAAAGPVEVTRQAVLLRMCAPCYEDRCIDCYGGPCLCAGCADDRPPDAPRPRRCRACGYELRSAQHKARCGEAAERIERLARSIGRR